MSTSGNPTDDRLVETIFRVLRDWRLSTMAQGDEPTEGYPLIDAVSTPTGTIESGETELGEIAAAIAEALQRSNAEMREALDIARKQIVKITCDATQKLREIGYECDPPERTYMPALDRIDKALSRSSETSK